MEVSHLSDRQVAIRVLTSAQAIPIAELEKHFVLVPSSSSRSRSGTAGTPSATQEPSARDPEALEFDPFLPENAERDAGAASESQSSQRSTEKPAHHQCKYCEPGKGVFVVGQKCTAYNRRRHLIRVHEEKVFGLSEANYSPGAGTVRADAADTCSMREARGEKART